MKYAGFFALGVALLTLTAWARRGKTRAARWWPGSPMSESAILFVVPGLGLMGVAAGASEVVDEWAPASIAFGFIALVGMVLGVWGVFFPLPQGWFPAWAWEESWTRAHRERKARRKQEKARRRG